MIFTWNIGGICFTLNMRYLIISTISIIEALLILNLNVCQNNAVFMMVIFMMEPPMALALSIFIKMISKNKLNVIEENLKTE